MPSVGVVIVPLAGKIVKPSNCVVAAKPNVVLKNAMLVVAPFLSCALIPLVVVAVCGPKMCTVAAYSSVVSLLKIR